MTESIDGPSLPRSVRWRLQLGLLEVPSGSRSLCEQNFLNLRGQRERYMNLIACNEQAYHESIKELQMGMASDVSTMDGVDDPLTAALKQREALEQYYEIQNQTALRRQSIHRRSSLRHRSDPLLVEEATTSYVSIYRFR